MQSTKRRDAPFPVWCRMDQRSLVVHLPGGRNWEYPKTLKIQREILAQPTGNRIVLSARALGEKWLMECVASSSRDCRSDCSGDLWASCSKAPRFSEEPSPMYFIISFLEKMSINTFNIECLFTHALFPRLHSGEHRDRTLTRFVHLLPHASGPSPYDIQL